MSLFRRKPKARCPVTADDQQFIESNFAWMRYQFGGVQQYPILSPSKVKLPKYETLEDLAYLILKFVCKRMDIDSDQVELDFYEKGQLDNHLHIGIQFDNGYSLGEYRHRNHLTGKFEIHLNLKGLEDPQHAMATMAHELGHLKLIGEGRIRGDEEANEPLTDLVAIYFGFGVFQANSYFQRKTWSNGDAWEGWSISKSGYLPTEMILYALALHTFGQNKLEPDWLKDLSRANRHITQDAIQYLRESHEGEGEIFQFKK